ncbi:putative RING finger domain protein [Talaromyces proteolyticus]|uniref:RING finger domain protein n=1 Tax=Talaromyces proteolyticus TaxID=1131652 RepID=A0AAD4L295_9EURO|nr:putative RING finger domain protein [Talaromyces proteolyticus]KAH8704220.1 putative RING finger domain protein [Talaromyces proteolyticus]
MSSANGQIVGSSKAIVSNSSVSSSSASFQGPSNSADGGAQRRPGGTGSFGAGSTSRTSPVARNSQSRKNNHKQHHRPSLVDEDAEAAVMRSTTNRRGQTSITHLMNFSLPPRPHRQTAPHRTRRNPTWGMGSGYHSVDKARYVHANYRFIVNPQNSYHAQAENADVHLDWNSVLQVLASEQTQVTSCPICLSMPVAPRMAKCGHIFCYSCLIRFMHSTDDEMPMPEKKPRWQKCPICWDTIYVSDCRPVRWFIGQENDIPVEGADVVLRLLKRNPGSTLALPRDGAEDLGPEDDIPWYHAAEVADYARIMKGGEDYMIAQYEAEIEDLKRQQQEDELLFGDDTTWSRKAIDSINEAKEKVRGIGNPPDIIRTEKKPVHAPVHFEQPQEGVPDMYAYQQAIKSAKTHSSSEPLNYFGDHGYGSPLAAVQSDQLAHEMDALKLDTDDPVNSRKKDKQPKSPAKKSTYRENAGSSNDQPYYFYQCLPHYYLSPLDIRILKTAFGDYSLFPATILPRVEHISTGHIVDDELRKRAKYFGHLPYGCEVSFLECDWTDIVVPEVLEQFHTEINKRRQRNRDKETRDEKNRLRAEKEEDEKRWAAARRKQSTYDSSERPFSEQDFLPLSGFTADAEDPASSPPMTSQMQSRFEALASPSTSPPTARTVWGTAAVNSNSPVATQQPVNDGWLRGWEDDLVEQQEAELIAQTMNDTPIASGGRKKKNKKITLMSTNIQRGA